jgi:alanyl-tRNA synthetase
VHAAYGYDNVGFHMGTDTITIDFNGLLTKEQLKEIEKKANEAVVANLDVQVQYPSKEELAHIKYRSKIEIEGQVRLVTVPGHDACACCAPHVKKTGEIGLIKLIGLQNYKGGVRVSMLCGARAIADYDEKSESMKQLSVMLSAPETEVVEEVQRLKEEISGYKFEMAKLQQKILEYKASLYVGVQDSVVLFDAELEGNAPRELVNLILDKQVKVVAVFARTGENQYRYVIGSRVMDVRPFAKILNEKFQGRGGGKPEMVQGSVTGTEREICDAFDMFL